MDTEFTTFKTPMAKTSHPEMDNNPILDPVQYSKFRSLVGCVNWLIILDRFNIQYAVNQLSRFFIQSREKYLVEIMRVFEYLNNFKKKLSLIQIIQIIKLLILQIIITGKNFIMILKKWFQIKERSQNLKDFTQGSLFTKTQIMFMIYLRKDR